MKAEILRQQLLEELIGKYTGAEAQSMARMLTEYIIEEANGNWKELISNVLKKIANGVPVQYVIGHTWFYDLKIRVSPDVLIPRPETEELVDWLVQDYRSELMANNAHILDVGTGSGCIAIALKKNMHHATVTACDISPGALEVASNNAMANEVNVEFARMDILVDTLYESFDVIVSNPPYVSHDEFVTLSPQVRDYEPDIALTPLEDDPLIFYKRLAALGKTQLNSNGSIYIELNEFHAMKIRALFIDEGYGTDMRKDMQGKWRMLKATNIT